MQKHVRNLGILNIVYGSLGVLAGLVVFVVLGGIAGFVANFESGPDADQAAPILTFIGILVFGLLAVVSAPSIIAGAGLLYYQPWARILTIVLSALHLLSIPFGTALGVYGFWTLLNPAAEALFQPVNLPPPAPMRPQPRA